MFFFCPRRLRGLIKAFVRWSWTLVSAGWHWSPFSEALLDPVYAPPKIEGVKVENGKDDIEVGLFARLQEFEYRNNGGQDSSGTHVCIQKHIRLFFLDSCQSAMSLLEISCNLTLCTYLSNLQRGGQPSAHKNPPFRTSQSCARRLAPTHRFRAFKVMRVGRKSRVLNFLRCSEASKAINSPKSRSASRAKGRTTSTAGF